MWLGLWLILLAPVLS